MTVSPIGSFTEYDVVRQAVAGTQARLVHQTSGGATEIVLAERMAAKRAELALARVRHYNAATGRTDIYL